MYIEETNERIQTLFNLTIHEKVEFGDNVTIELILGDNCLVPFAS